MQTLQVPTPYPTALFIRDKALVVNLESIRMIVSADQVSLQLSCGCCTVTGIHIQDRKCDTQPLVLLLACLLTLTPRHQYLKT